MGTGIAIAIANAGMRAHIVDSSQAALEGARASIDAAYRSAVERGKLTSNAAGERRRQIAFDFDFTSFARADVVIEAAFEDLAVKRDIFARLGAVVPGETVLATNTSSLDIDAITGDVPRPERALGLHFFSPANVMKLLEIVRGARTSDATLAWAVDFATRLGKIGVVVGNCDGFVGNRMLLRYRREAELCLERGATPQQVDAALEAFGFAMGPFAVSDLAGLDIAYRSKQERRKRGADVPFRQSTIPDRLVEAGRLGQKTLAGYYRYERGRRDRIVDPEVEALIARERAGLSNVPQGVGDDEVVERSMLALVNEGARILEAGIAASAEDIDRVWRYGYGFPAARGGPMAYAATLDRKALSARLQELEKEDAAFWDAGVVERRL